MNLEKLRTLFWQAAKPLSSLRSPFFFAITLLFVALTLAQWFSGGEALQQKKSLWKTVGALPELARSYAQKKKREKLSALQEALAGREKELKRKEGELSRAVRAFQEKSRALEEREKKVLREEQAVKRAKKRLAGARKTRKERGAQEEELVKIYKKMAPEEIAKLLPKLDAQLALSILSKLPAKTAAQVLALLSPDRAAFFSQAFVKSQPKPKP